MSVYVIAEIGVNHNGSMDLAKRLIEEAAKAGCDAAKFQTFKADNLVTRNAEKAAYQQQNTGTAESQYDMLKRLELTFDQFAELKEYCETCAIEFLSTPFDDDSVALLEDLGVTRYKVGSGDLTNKPLIERIASTGKPVILSTGMASLEEVADALSWVRASSEAPITLLHCTSNYPTAYDEVDMRAMLTLRDAFGCEVGYSDHTIGCEIPLMAVAMGACVIEKHITLDQAMEGPDHRATLETRDLESLVSMIRHVEMAFGDAEKHIRPSEERTASVARKSLIVARDLSEGHVIEQGDIVIKRPGTGLAPRYFDQVMGKTVTRDLSTDEPLTEQDVCL